MSKSSGGKDKRTPPPKRRILVDGEEFDPSTRKQKPRTLAQLVGKDAASNSPPITQGERKKRVRAFAQGKITLAELEGISPPELQNIAQVGYGLLQAGQFDKAEVIFKGLLTLNPYDSYCFLALGSIEQRRDNFQHAEAFYSRALQLNISLSAAFANRGEVRLKLGRVDEAVDDLKQAIERDSKNKDPSTPRARANLAAIKAGGHALSPPTAIDPKELQNKTASSGGATQITKPAPPRSRPQPRKPAAAATARSKKK